MTFPHKYSPRPTKTMPKVAMIGGGQLARMTAQSVIELGQTLRVVATDPEESAAQVTPDIVIGSHTDIEAVRKAAEGADVVTFDHEHVPQDLMAELVGEGVNFQPQPEALIYAQDKLKMRKRLQEMGAPVPPFAHLRTDEDVAQFWEEQSGEVIIKTARGGYDGHGVWAPKTLAEAQEIVRTGITEHEMTMLGECKVPWVVELSSLVARSPEGQGAAWPVTRSIQRDGICAVAMAPAPDLPAGVAENVQELGLKIARELEVTGVLAVELFLLPDNSLLVNELAMRPHNTGHWTQDGCATSQFEQHVRAVLDYPLGDVSLKAPFTVMANVLGAPETPTMSMDERAHHLFARFPNAKLHMYGKGERPGRKLGHVNVCGDPDGSIDDPHYVKEVWQAAELAAHWMAAAEWQDGWNPHTGDK
ncbi:MAG TPA: 5-(carboxyamino)imidazole ribonucleotide synthase [Corynebacteriales bacterium]|nr:5-(carboxyamino)imidazole ribonucleotide synthase [Mycobacteriales bacterium]